jgi:O-methyltransferase involved in polyketide biosynthesis
MPVQSGNDLEGVAETLLIPLYVRAQESQRPDALLQDERAVAFVSERGFDLRGLELDDEDLAADSSLRTIMLATSVDNTVAIRCYEKAGFERRRMFDDPECGRCWLLARDVRPSV